MEERNIKIKDFIKSTQSKIWKYEIDYLPEVLSHEYNKGIGLKNSYFTIRWSEEIHDNVELLFFWNLRELMHIKVSMWIDIERHMENIEDFENFIKEKIKSCMSGFSELYKIFEI